MLKKKISKDTPLFEITLRKYEQPSNFGDRQLIKKFCLSVGLLQPGDSRDIIVDILFALLKKRRLTRKELEDEIIKIRKEHNLDLKGTASSNIRRQLLRLRELHIVQKKDIEYFIGDEFRELNSIFDLFKENIEKFILRSIIERIEDYCKEIDKRFV